LSWTHFLQLLPGKTDDARWFYAQQSVESRWSVRELHQQIESKAFERTELATLQAHIPVQTEPVVAADTDPAQVFKDPYFLDFLGLRQGHDEADLESAILHQLEAFILELGRGFAFVERQKRMVIDGDDFYLDLLFFHRRLRRLVAIELKLGRFKAAHKGQMELYLKWLDKHERQPGEEAPIGLILCAESSREQVELLQMHKDGITAAEYWTELPPKAELEQKLHATLLEAPVRLARPRGNWVKGDEVCRIYGDIELSGGGIGAMPRRWADAFEWREKKPVLVLYVASAWAMARLFVTISKESEIGKKLLALRDLGGVRLKSNT
jgi:predicted nuclease of restriction endonuclease-like (RecB) superfamily